MTKPLFWLWLPLVFAVLQALIELTLAGDILVPLHRENGPHELFQFFIIAAAAVVAWRTLKDMRKDTGWLTGWIVVAALCCTYVAIEEMSWGQTVLQWNTPDFWLEVNKQKETNLHNTSDWLDQKPRNLLQVGIVVGGLIIPFLARFKPSWLPARFTIIYPPAILAVTAGLLVGSRLANFVGHHIMGYDLFTRSNEVYEVYMYYFVLLYLIIMRQRLKA